MWQNLVRCVKSFKTFLLKTIFCRASNTSKLGDIYSFAFTCFLVRSGCTHFVNLLLPVHSCLFWMWNRTLIHFSRRSSGSPSHVAHAHQKWFPIDLIHFSIILQEDFLLAASNFFLMFLTKCHTSKWWMIPGSWSLNCFLICIWWSVVICSRIILSFFTNHNDFSNSIFSIRFKFPASETWAKENLIRIFIHERISQVLALWPGLSHLPSPLR